MGCAVAALLTNWIGGFSLVVTAVFVVILLTGAMLIGNDEPVAEVEPSDEEAEIYPYEDGIEADEDLATSGEAEVAAVESGVEVEDEIEVTEVDDGLEDRPAVGVRT